MRDPAETPEAAQQRYLRFLQLALSCLTEAEWVIGPAPGADADRGLAASEDPIRLARQRGLSTLLFVPSQRFELVEDERYEGEWKVRTLAYIYRVYIDSRRLAERVEVMAWHWHPLRTPDRVEPHIHVRVNHPLLGLALRKLHIPSGRVSFEEVVRFLVEELRVLPRDDNWRSVLNETEARFRHYRTWT